MRELALVVAAGRVAAADLRTIYTPLTWTLGWVGRMLAQVLFFATIGLLLPDGDAVTYLFVGQAVMACVVESFFAVASTTWERGAGTLPLLVASPAPLWPVLVGRSAQWVPSGVATSAIALLGLGPLLGVTWTPGAALVAVGVLVLVSAGSYAFALLLGAAVLRAPRWRNAVGNVGHLVVMLLAGVTVPVSTWPAWCGVVAQALPLTHGLRAVRALQAGADDGVPVDAALTALTGAGWLGAAALAFTAVARAGRRDGALTLED